MTKEQAQEMIILLAREFRMRPPELRWTARTNRGRANWRRQQIVIGPSVWRGVEATLVHEFAHMLTDRVYPQPRFVFHRREIHGEEFCLCLKRVAFAWYGDPTRYPWASEYKRVAKYGIKLRTAAQPGESQ